MKTRRSWAFTVFLGILPKAKYTVVIYETLVVQF